jgi:type II secretory pathway pseudopilin PulG
MRTSRQRAASGEQKFTLIELLVAIALIGIFRRERHGTRTHS